MKSCQMYRFIPIMLLCVCSLADVPKTRISPLPRTTRPRPQKLPPIRITPHRYLPRRQTAPKLLQQILQLLISPTRKKDILWQNTPVSMQNPNCS